MSDWLFSLKNIRGHLSDEASNFKYLLRHGSMKAGLYAAAGEDTQTPHKQDELYIVASGHGTFVKNGEAQPFGPNDLIFVEAGVQHRFVEFSDDFAVWVIFWGPEGGEAP